MDPRDYELQSVTSPPKEEKAKRIQTTRNKKPFWRFKTIPYLEEHIPIGSKLQQRTSILFTIVQGYLNYRNQAKWAKCCRTFLRNVPDGVLGHPPEETIDVGDLIRTEGIATELSLSNFFLKTLPRNAHGLIRMPQCNMMHKDQEEQVTLSNIDHTSAYPY